MYSKAKKLLCTQEGGCLRISGSRLRHPNIPLPWKGGGPIPNFLEVRAVLKVPWSARLVKGSKALDGLTKATDQCGPRVPTSLERSKIGGESQSQTGILQTPSQREEFARLNIPADSKPGFHLGDRRRRSRRGGRANSGLGISRTAAGGESGARQRTQGCACRF